MKMLWMRYQTKIKMMFGLYLCEVKCMILLFLPAYKWCNNFHNHLWLKRISMFKKEKATFPKNTLKKSHFFQRFLRIFQLIVLLCVSKCSCIQYKVKTPLTQIHKTLMKIAKLVFFFFFKNPFNWLMFSGKSKDMQIIDSNIVRMISQKYEKQTKTT